jgi:rhamnogalacturonan endolyase
VAFFLMVVSVVTMSAQIQGTTLVRHAPTLNGANYVDGSLQMLLGEGLTINGGAGVTGDLLLPGTPTVTRNGPVFIGATVLGTGASTPSGYQIILNGNVHLGRLITRTNAVSLPVVTLPPAPTGTRITTVNGRNQSVGSFATLKDLTINGNCGDYAIPAGTYGNFIVNGAAASLSAWLARRLPRSIISNR